MNFRMKGIEIIALWEKARQSVKSIGGHPGGEIGDGLRRNGYAVCYNGCSVCDFIEMNLHISYSADCCGRPWTLSNWLWIYPYTDDRRGHVKISDIDPEKEYEIVDNPSLAELFDAGRLKIQSMEGESLFTVSDNGGRYYHEKKSFNSFEQADAFAKKLARDEIDRLNKDKELRRYTSTKVENDALRAKEKDELRHYQYYNYQNHRYWISVQPVRYEILPGDGEKKEENEKGKEVA